MKKEKLKERRRGMTGGDKEKVKEAFQAVFPIALIVVGLSLTLTPLESGTFLLLCHRRAASDCGHGAVQSGRGHVHARHRAKGGLLAHERAKKSG